MINELERALRSSGQAALLIVERRGEDGLTVLSSPMMSTQQAARYIGVGRNQFRELVERGRIKARGSGHRKYHQVDLDRYLQGEAKRKGIVS